MEEIKRAFEAPPEHVTEAVAGLHGFLSEVEEHRGRAERLAHSKDGRVAALARSFLHWLGVAVGAVQHAATAKNFLAVHYALSALRETEGRWTKLAAVAEVLEVA